MLKKYLPLIIIVVVFFMFKDKIMAMIKPKTDPAIKPADAIALNDLNEDDTNQQA